MNNVTTLKDRAASSDQSAPQPEQRIRIRSAAEIAASIQRNSWVLRPYIERNAIVILYGDYGTFKSFVTLDWALRVSLGLAALGHAWPSEASDVVFISAEGRGLPQRLRGWCMRNFATEAYPDVLERARFFGIEHPVNLSDPACALALVDRIAELELSPALVVVDTMSRNSDGRIENSTSDAAAYIANLDHGLRSRYQCAVVLTHHVGHLEKGRIRGPIVLAANTDTLIRIERPDPKQRLATLTVERLKDGEPPDPQGLQAHVVELGEVDADGEPLTSLALEASTAIPTAVAAVNAQPRGKAQRQLLSALRAQGTPGAIWTSADLREVGRKAGLHKNTARDATEALTCSPHMVPTVGGWRLADA